MQTLLKILTVTPFLFLTACSSDSPAAKNADLQGTWVTSCLDDGDGDKEQEQLVFSGDSLQRSIITYISTDTCDGDNFVSVTASGTYSVSDGITELAGGNAKHVDVSFSNGSITAGTLTTSILESQGTSLQDIYTNEGIPDVNNVQLDSLGIPEVLFSIYRVTGTRLSTGETLGANDGSSAASRHSVLDEDVDGIFTKK